MLIRLLTCLCVLCGALLPMQAQAQGNAFAYQGRLLVGGAPATGTFDFQMRVFNDAVAGSAIGSQMTLSDVPVQNGLFTVTLDPGINVFNGFNRFLFITVRPGTSTGAYTPLTPRQRILPAPYAIYSGNANNLDGLDAVAFQRVGQPINVSGFSNTALINASLTSSSQVGGAAISGSTSTPFSGSFGVRGAVTNPTAPMLSAGVFGEVTGTGQGGYGVWGDHKGTLGVGVYGTAEKGFGVYGLSSEKVGVLGASYNDSGMSGSSWFGEGVKGTSQLAAGVRGISVEGTGVTGFGNLGSGGLFESENAPALRARINNSNSESPAVVVDQFGEGRGMDVNMFNPASNRSGIEVFVAGSGPGVAITNSAGSGLTATNNSSEPTLRGNNSSGPGIYGESNAGSTRGVVEGRNTNGAGAGVLGTHAGAGTGVVGRNTASGVAGRFEVQNPSNGSSVIDVAGEGSGYGVNISNPNGRGLRVDAGIEQSALEITRGRLVITPQEDLSSINGALNSPLISVILPGSYTLKTDGVQNGTTIWLVNKSNGTVFVNNVAHGTSVINPLRARQFIYFNQLGLVGWYEVE